MANGWYYHEDFKASRRGEVKRGEVRRGVSAPNLDRRTPVYSDDDTVPSNAWAIRSISVANLEHDENAGDFDVSEFRFFTTWQRQPAVRKVYAERAAAKNRREKQAEALRIAAEIAARHTFKPIPKLYQPPGAPATFTTQLRSQRHWVPLGI
jgi:hypothetical protein